MADGKGSKRKGVDQPHDEKKKLKGDEDQDKEQDFLSDIKNARLNVCKSVEEFKYNKKRVRIISRCEEFPDACDGIVYWMSRDQRVQDNWAFLYAQKLALKMQVTLHVCFCLVPMFLDANIRHYGFMLKGLQEVEEDLLEESWMEVEQQSSCKRSPLSMRECRSLGISFNLLIGYAKDVLPDYVKKNKIGGVVTDFSPLRLPLQWVKDVGDALPKSVPFCQVDAHNIVPCWETSPKLEYGARTIRNKIHDKLSKFLTEFPPVISHPHKAKSESEPLDWKAAEVSLQVDRSISEVTWAKPGTIGGLLMLESFCKERLKYFASDRNNPNKNALSNLSPWIHFGQISVQRCILMVRMYRGRFKDGVEAFVEEAVVRRELADNFCYYNENYDKVEGAYDWARKTLKDHEKDKRPYLYTREQLEKAKTHDDLWNSAQIQMVLEGKMHGFLRMYWAKKILEWTKTPQEALEISIYLNDKYNLDGRDPNGYVGCMWSICGIHDQGWAEREVFGKIRYMNYAGCKRKFDVSLFERKYKNNNSDLIEKHKEG